MKQRMLALIILMAMLLLAIPAQAADLSPQERMYLSELYPAPPKNAASYPAKLLVSAGSVRAELHGTCGMDASLAPEDMLDILKQALTNSKYQDLDAVITDKHSVESLTNKLDMSDKAADEVFNNLLTLVGWDDVLGKFTPISVPAFDELNGNLFHDYETVDGIKTFGEKVKDLWEILAGNGDLVKFLKPEMLPSIQQFLYNGAKITWEEFQKDQQKYRDIVTLSQANARLRAYYGRVDDLVRNAQSEKGAWAIRILDQQIVTGLYDPLYAQTVPYSFTADIELVKQGNISDIGGDYTGRFVLKQYTDLSEYDSKRHILYADYMNQNLEQNAPKVGGRSYLPFEPVSLRINKPAESYFTLAGENVSVKLTLPAGKSRTFFELPLDATALEQTEYVNVCDYVMVVKQEDKDVKVTFTITEFTETDSNYRNDQWVCVTPSGTETYSKDDSASLPTDMRPYIQLTLTIDMLDG